MDKGCIGYIGYKDYFWIGSLDDDPKKDIISRMFKDPVNIASISLIKGSSVEEAFFKSQETYNKKIEECRKKYFNPLTNADMREYLKDIISSLIWNKKHQVYFS